FLDGDDWTPLSALRSVFLGGEPLSPARLARWRISPGCRAEIVNSYGPTECTDVVAFWRLAPPGSPAATVPIGRPVPNSRLWIVSPDLTLVPQGVSGELSVGGDSVGQGYLTDAGLTAARFVPDPFLGVPGARLYRTGDLARHLPGGEIEYLGRIDHQVKVRGFRIELGEIESVLAGHPGVAAAVVLAAPPRGAEQEPTATRLVAYLVPDPETARPLAELLRLEREGSLAERPSIELPNGLVVFHQNRSETEFLYRELFEEHSYFRHGIELQDGATVFNVGANIGLFDLLLARSVPGVEIFAFEPLPPIYEVLRANLDLYGVRARTFKHGLASVSGSATFDYFPHVSILSGRFADAAAERETLRKYMLAQPRPGEAIPSEEEMEDVLTDRLEKRSFVCPMRTLSEVVREHGVEVIDLLKVDVEKAELDVLQGLAEEDWPKVRQVVAEVHDLDGRLGEITQLLTRHGFEVTTEQDEQLRVNDLYNLYARRPPASRAPGTPQDAAVAWQPGAPALPWCSRERLVADVKRHARERLPEFMAPTAFVVLDSLPLTPSGKVDRRALPPPERDLVEPQGAFLPPRDPVEEVLALLWAQVLGRERLGMRDNFFDLGGHSLLATQVMSRVREAFQVELPLRSLFGAPTIEAFARVVSAARHREETPAAPPLAARARTGGEPLSFAQQRLWFLHQLDRESSAYHIPLLLELAGRLDEAALARALAQLVDRHETLRTTFSLMEGGPVQVIAAPREWRRRRLPMVDLTALGAERREAEVLHLASGEAARLFDLERGPIFRALLLRLDRRQHALSLTLHHIAADAWSMGILWRETMALYAAQSTGRPAVLPAQPIQYADFAAWQREWLAGEVLAAELAHWRERLAGAPALLELPTDRPRSPLQRFRGGQRKVAVPCELAERLTLLGRRSGATPFMALLAGLDVLLHRYSRQSDLVVGSPIAGRNRTETEGLIGLFLNTLALRLHVDGSAGYRGLLRQAREATLDAYAHQELPFEKLVTDLALERSLAHAPLFQVLLVLQNTPPLDAELPGLPDLDIHQVELESGTAKFDLVFNLEELAEKDTGIAGWLLYNSDLFDPPTAERLLRHFGALLDAATGDPERPVDELPLLSPAERHQLVRD
ncbi:MAG TPA: FkbM family methyltransferase, partial [Thermoanaerobaculia bacterium]|nr:FkbM family methyltransferase [Thermoanaerobaculia bacterium]